MVNDTNEQNDESSNIPQQDANTCVNDSVPESSDTAANGNLSGSTNSIIRGKDLHKKNVLVTESAVNAAIDALINGKTPQEAKQIVAQTAASTARS